MPNVFEEIIKKIGNDFQAAGQKMTNGMTYIEKMTVDLMHQDPSHRMTHGTTNIIEATAKATPEMLKNSAQTVGSTSKLTHDAIEGVIDYFTPASGGKKPAVPAQK